MADLFHQIIQPERRNFVDFRQRGTDFHLGGVLDPGNKSLADCLFAVRPHTNNKRKTKPFLICPILFLEPRRLLLIQTVEPGDCLFRSRRRCERSFPRRPADKIGVRANERQLLIGTGRANTFLHRRKQMGSIAKWLLLPGFSGDPGRMLENRAELRDKALAAQCVDFWKGEFHAMLFA